MFYSLIIFVLHDGSVKIEVAVLERCHQISSVNDLLASDLLLRNVVVDSRDHILGAVPIVGMVAVMDQIA